MVPVRIARIRGVADGVVPCFGGCVSGMVGDGREEEERLRSDEEF
jgi:hypothetical protein